MDQKKENLLDILEPMLFNDLIDSFVNDGTMSPFEGAVRKAWYEDDRKPIPVPIRTETKLDYLEDFMCDDLLRKWRHEAIADRLLSIWMQCDKSATGFHTLVRRMNLVEEQVACEAMLFFRKHLKGSCDGRNADGG